MEKLDRHVGVARLEKIDRLADVPQAGDPCGEDDRFVVRGDLAE